jgi:NDP-sugar pyrophosphorylase family protein
MHSKDMLSNKKHDTTSWDHVVQLQGSSHDIQEWREKKQYEEQHTHTYIYMHVYTVYMYYIFTTTIIYLQEYYIPYLFG